MEPFFSVIIPTYNRATLITKAVDSVLSQTYKDWELVIIDDGSKDNTKEVIASYTDPRIRYIYQQNAERCAARNNGVQQSQGKYICFLDSDDYFLPNRLELLYAELQKRNFPVAFFYTGMMLEKNGTRWEFTENQHHLPSKWDTIALSVIHSQQTCSHRDILHQHKYDTAFHIGEDMELWLRVAEKNDFIYLPNQPTVVVVSHDERTVNYERSNIYIDQLRMLRHAFASNHPGHNISADIKARLIGYAYYGMMRYHIYNNNRASAIASIAKAIVADPKSKHFKFRINVLLQLATLRSMQQVKELIAH